MKGSKTAAALEAMRQAANARMDNIALQIRGNFAMLLEPGLRRTFGQMLGFSEEELNRILGGDNELSKLIESVVTNPLVLGGPKCENYGCGRDAEWQFELVVNGRPKKVYTTCGRHPS